MATWGRSRTIPAGVPCGLARRHFPCVPGTPRVLLPVLSSASPGPWPRHSPSCSPGTSSAGCNTRAEGTSTARVWSGRKGELSPFLNQSESLRARAEDVLFLEGCLAPNAPFVWGFAHGLGMGQKMPKVSFPESAAVLKVPGRRCQHSLSPSLPFPSLPCARKRSLRTRPPQLVVSKRLGP